VEESDILHQFIHPAVNKYNLKYILFYIFFFLCWPRGHDFMGLPLSLAAPWGLGQTPWGMG
jgi:hypothetical protein